MSVPRLEVEHARLKRAVDEQSARHELLALKVSQLVAAEARPGGLAEVIDPPVEPRVPTGPSLVKLVVAGTLGGALLAGAVVLLLARSPRAGCGSLAQPQKSFTARTPKGQTAAIRRTRKTKHPQTFIVCLFGCPYGGCLAFLASWRLAFLECFDFSRADPATVGRV